jgi:hypothetical protein
VVQDRRFRRGQHHVRGGEQRPRLVLGESQVGRADLGQIACHAELVQAQPQVVTRRYHGMDRRGQLGEEPCYLGERLRRVKFVEIVDNEDHRAALAVELREHSVGQCGGIEV